MCLFNQGKIYDHGNVMGKGNLMPLTSEESADQPLTMCILRPTEKKTSIKTNLGREMRKYKVQPVTT